MDKKNTQIKQIPVKNIAHLSIHKDKKDDTTLQRVNRAELKYPILIIDTNLKYMIIDGHHRLQKAINTNLGKINAKIININELPDEWKFLFE